MKTLARRCPLLSLSLVSLSILTATRVASADDLPKVGQKAKPFRLQSVAGREVQLASLTKQGPVVLLVLRGFPGYQCPLCSRQVGDFVGQAARFAEAQAQIVMVYPGPAEELAARARQFLGSRRLPENVHLVLDPDYRFTLSYGLRWDAVRETAYPTTLVIDSDGVIQFAKISKTHGGRTRARDVLAAVQSAE